jgi:hypothetical protein
MESTALAPPTTPNLWEATLVSWRRRSRMPLRWAQMEPLRLAGAA